MELSNLDIVLRLVVAMVLCGAIGFEREHRHKPAGLRTLILVGLGTAIVSIGAIQLSADNTAEFERLVAGILPGIGFLGAGSIIQARGNVVGLTTAASIWVVAAIGVACGFGLFPLAIVATLLTLVTLIVLPVSVGEENGTSKK